jgi:hypothetical protein
MPASRGDIDDQRDTPASYDRYEQYDPNLRPELAALPNTGTTDDEDDDDLFVDAIDVDDIDVDEDHDRLSSPHDQSSDYRDVDRTDLPNTGREGDMSWQAGDYDDTTFRQDDASFRQGDPSYQRDDASRRQDDPNFARQDYTGSDSGMYGERNVNDQYDPVTRYGYSLHEDDRYRGRNWEEIEHEVHRDWDERNPGTWEQFRDSIRRAWQEFKDTMD